MNAEEKRQKIEGYTQAEKPGFDLLLNLRGKLSNLIAEGHTPDCPARDNVNKSMCTCGTALADEWLERHPAAA